MKIRNGFVTNSSSTSFLISLKKDWGKESFLTAVGADGMSPMNQIFEELFETVNNQKQEIHRAIEELYEKELTVSEFLKKEGFDDETVEVIEGLIAEGRTVYYGSMESAAEKSSEIYFCCRSFVVCEDDIYFNGSIGGW